MPPVTGVSWLKIPELKLRRESPGVQSSENRASSNPCDVASAAIRSYVMLLRICSMATCKHLLAT